MNEPLGIGILLSPLGILMIILIRWIWIKWVAEMHWFAFVYKGDRVISGRTASASVYVGYQNKSITKKQIDENKANAGVTSNAVLLNVIYLGRMTKKNFNQDDQIGLTK